MDLVAPAAVLLATLVLLVALSKLGGLEGQALGVALGLVATGCLVLVRRPVRFGLAVGGLLSIPLVVGQGAVFVDRGFFGVNRVVDQGGIRLMVHGTTTHGGQLLDPARSLEPLTYYHRSGPFGRVMSAYLAAHPAPVRMGIIGLGAGGITAYARPGDTITYFEIDPTVVQIASDRALFSYLSDTQADLRMVQGDGRLTLAEQEDASFDVLVLDAFSGDAPPAHLLTIEAIDLYARKLAGGGILLFNASNRYVDVGAVIAAGLAERGLPVAFPGDPAPGTPPAPEKEASSWIASALEMATLDRVLTDVPTSSPGVPRVRAWTDDYSDLISSIRWDR